MKRILAVIVAILIFSMSAVIIFAAGSFTQTLEKYPNANMQVLTYRWLGDASSGLPVAAGLATTTAITDSIKGWYIYSVETAPGTTAPTTLYDVYLKDELGLDVTGGLLVNRSATLAEKIIPKVDTANGIFGGVMVDSILALTVTANTAAGAGGTVKIVLTK